MRIAVSLCGESVTDWKVDCGDYLPDGKGGDGDQNLFVSNADVSIGRQQICVLPKDKYRIFSGVCSCRESWADTIAVTR